MNERRAYCGLLDDFAIRHRDRRAITRLEKLNDHLVFSVIAGDPLVVNDGYLLQNPAVREAIVNPGRSPFRQLVECGFIRILSRNGGAIEQLAQAMAEQNISSAEQLLSDPRYQHEYQPTLASWSVELNTGFFDWFRAWPTYRTDHVFGLMAASIIRSLLDMRGEQRREIETFRDTLGDAVGSRTAWEDTARALLGSKQLSRVIYDELMAGANEAYQYAWGCMLADTQNPMSVQTGVPRFLSEFDLVDGAPTDEMRHPVTLFVPQLDVASKGIGRRWDLFAQAVHPASDVSRAKRRFLQALTKYNTGDGVAEQEMRAIATEYSQTLARAFARKRKAQVGFDITFAALSIGTSVALTGGLGVAIGVGITAAGLTGSYVPPAQNLIARLGQTQPRKWIQQLPAAEAARIGSSFALDPSAVRGVLDGAPRFTD